MFFKVWFVGWGGFGGIGRLSLPHPFISNEKSLSPDLVGVGAGELLAHPPTLPFILHFK